MRIFKKTLEDFGFKQLESCECVFKGKHNRIEFAISVFVDYLAILIYNIGAIVFIKNEIKSWLKVTDLCKLVFYLRRLFELEGTIKFLDTFKILLSNLEAVSVELDEFCAPTNGRNHRQSLLGFRYEKERRFKAINYPHQFLSRSLLWSEQVYLIYIAVLQKFFSGVVKSQSTVNCMAAKRIVWNFWGTSWTVCCIVNTGSIQRTLYSNVATLSEYSNSD